MHSDESEKVLERSPRLGGLWEIGPRARDVAAQAAQRIVPGSQNYINVAGIEHFPRYITHGKGALVWDVDGKEYIDLYAGSGSIILGHGYPAQVDVLRRRLEYGPSISLRHPVETELAAWLHERLACAERTMFFKTGSEAAHAALRAACHYAGRPRVLSFGYHGWLPPYTWSWPRAEDVEVIDLSWDLDAVLAAIRTHEQDVGAVIVSPDPAMLDRDFYRTLEAEVRRIGAVFIMDEIKSGFRLKFPCLSAAYGLDPDILLLSKAFSNGFPISVLTGKDALLGDEKRLSLFSTFAAETLSLFAAQSCAQLLEDGAFAAFEAAATALYNAFQQELACEAVQIVGAPTFFRVTLSDASKALEFARRLAFAGILYHPFDLVLVSASHNDEALLSKIVETFCQTARHMQLLP